MGHVRYSGHLDATPEAAWEVVVRPERYPDWDPLFCRVTDVAGALDRPGAAFRGVLRIAGRQLDARIEAISAERPRRLMLVGFAGPDLRFTWSWRFAPVGAGVEVSVELDYDLADNLAGDLADLLFVERSIGRSVRTAVENFGDLAKSLEASTAPVG